MPHRKLQFECLFDDHVISVDDAGRGKVAGTDTTSRHQLRHIVNKRTMVEGREFPVFLLAEVPPTLSPSDDFDRKELQDVRGAWNLAANFTEWKRIRERNITQRLDRQASAQLEADRRMARNVVDNIAKLAGNARDVAQRIDPQRAATVAGDAAFEQALKEGKSRDAATKIARVAAEKARADAVEKKADKGAGDGSDGRDAKIADLEKKLAELQQRAAAGGAVPGEKPAGGAGG